MEYCRVIPLLRLLVLDCWIREFSGRLYVFRLWGSVPNLLDNPCAGGCIGKLDGRNRWVTILVFIYLRSNFVCVLSYIFSFKWLMITPSNGVLQPYRQLGWWRWMYHVSPFTYLIGALLGQGPLPMGSHLMFQLTLLKRLAIRRSIALPLNLSLLILLLDPHVGLSCKSTFPM